MTIIHFLAYGLLIANALTQALLLFSTGFSVSQPHKDREIGWAMGSTFLLGIWNFICFTTAFVMVTKQPVPADALPLACGYVVVDLIIGWTAFISARQLYKGIASLKGTTEVAR